MGSLQSDFFSGVSVTERAFAPPFLSLLSKHHKKSHKYAKKARTAFQPRVRSFRMGKGVSCLTFTWSRSHDHSIDQSYLLQNTISLCFSSLRLNATCDSQHSPLLNKRSTLKKNLLTKTYISI